MAVSRIATVRRAILAAVSLSALLVVYVLGSTSSIPKEDQLPLVLLIGWNLLPLVFAWAIARGVRDSAAWENDNYSRLIAAIGGASLTFAVVAGAHLSWLFDWGGTASGSSTAGLMFVTLPILASVAGIVAFLGGWALGAVSFWLTGSRG